MKHTNKNLKSNFLYTLLCNVFTYSAFDSVVRFLSPRFALDSEGQVNKWTYLILFQLVLISFQLVGLLICYS